MTQPLFITGTDTEVGKTTVSGALIKQAIITGKTALGCKPVAAGAQNNNGQLINEDALVLQQASSISLDYTQINPVVFEQPIAPHIAAQLNHTSIHLTNLIQHCQELQTQTDVLIVEGAGGWYVPLNLENTLADLAVALHAQVVLVVDIKLGCINHSLLTQQAIKSSGAQLIGSVANHTHLSVEQDEQIVHDLEQLIHAPILANIPYLNDKNSLDIQQYFTHNLFS